MGDEELGRAWCAANGKRPKLGDDGLYYWFRPQVGFRVGAETLSHLLYRATVQPFASEKRAYAAVGAALRTVLKLADEVRAITGGAG